MVMASLVRDDGVTVGHDLDPVSRRLLGQVLVVRDRDGPLAASRCA